MVQIFVPTAFLGKGNVAQTCLSIRKLSGSISAQQHVCVLSVILRTDCWVSSVASWYKLLTCGSLCCQFVICYIFNRSNFPLFYLGSVWKPSSYLCTGRQYVQKHDDWPWKPVRHYQVNKSLTHLSKPRGSFLCWVRRWPLWIRRCNSNAHVAAFLLRWMPVDNWWPVLNGWEESRPDVLRHLNRWFGCWLGPLRPTERSVYVCISTLSHSTFFSKSVLCNL